MSEHPAAERRAESAYLRLAGEGFRARLTGDGATLADLLALWQRYDVARQLGCSCETCVLKRDAPDRTLLDAVRAATKDDKP